MDYEALSVAIAVQILIIDFVLNLMPYAIVGFIGLMTVDWVFSWFR